MSNDQAKLNVSPEVFQIYPSSSPESCVQVTNVSFAPVLYRALSTAPKQFQVRPRQGVIESGKSTTIVITYTTKAAADAAAAGTEPRKEEFKIEYCKQTEAHVAAIASAPADNKDIVTELIKGTSKADKKSKVITCFINSTEKKSAATTETAAAAAPVVEKKVEAAPTPASSAPATATHRVSDRVEATTDALTGKAPAAAAEDSGLRARTSAALPPAAAGRPSTSTTAASTPAPTEAKLPEKVAINKAADSPVAILTKNPLVAAGAVLALLLLLKVLFF